MSFNPLEHTSIDSAGCYPLDWTGNHFIDPVLISTIVTQVATTIDFTRHGDPHAEGLRVRLGARYGVIPELIAVGVGSSQVLEALLRLFAAHEIVEVIPNFRMTRLVANRDHRHYRVLLVPNVDALLPAVIVAHRRHKQLLSLCSPSNPQGWQVPLEVLRALLDHFEGPVIIDEAYADFADSTALSLVPTYPHLIVTRTFSKAWGLANLRLGFVVSSLINGDFRERFLLRYAVGELGQRVASALLDHPEAIIQSIADTRDARTRISAWVRLFPALRVHPSDANYLCCEFPAAVALQDYLLQRGLKTARLRALPNYPPHWPDGLRISVPKPAIEQHLKATCEEFFGIRVRE
jgi:histidinol-phosphate aminotransferase